jgi:hypothetical protein
VPTISYDEPVKDLIAGLSATGHVTHTKFRKTMVTLHHNAGVLTHEDVLDAWKTREASAHFDVDIHGAVAQYVDVNEYAWACGNTVGNQTSISIEMSNSATGGNWPVAAATWLNAARLAAWLFVHVIGERPDTSNLVPHHHWYSTACSGPYMDSIWWRVVSAAQEAYNRFAHPIANVEESKMKDLILAQHKGTPDIWVGDGLLRRKVADTTELEGLEWWIGQKGGDNTVQPDFEDLRVLGVDVATFEQQTTPVQPPSA